MISLGDKYGDKTAPLRIRDGLHSAKIAADLSHRALNVTLARKRYDLDTSCLIDMSTLDVQQPKILADLEPSCLKCWTVQEYHRMAELGLLDQAERTELIGGQVILMAAKGTPHVVALSLTANLLRDRLGTRALIRTQDPIQLDDYSEPEPDLAVVQGVILDYLDHHPQPVEVYWVIEVADSTLKTDCGVKDKVYAQSGLTEYWVLDVTGRQLHVFREPTPTGYAQHDILTESANITPLAFPDVSLAVAAMLPPIV
jgi:Uma2 family endonuclease